MQYQFAAAPQVTYAAPQSTVTYARPQTYAAPVAYTEHPQQIYYAAPQQVQYHQPAATYAASQQIAFAPQYASQQFTYGAQHAYVAPQTESFTLPGDAFPGKTYEFEAADGRLISFQVPQGYGPGCEIAVSY